MAKYLKKIPKIVFFHREQGDAARERIQGIQRYGKLYGPWDIQVLTNDVRKVLEMVLTKSRKDRISGILAHVLRDDEASLLAELKVPLVFLDPSPLWRKTDPNQVGIPYVVQNHKQAGILAADFFLEKRMPHFAFVSSDPETCDSEDRCHAFTIRLMEKGHSVYRYSRATRNGRADEKSSQKHLAQWLQKLPKPVGLLAVSDAVGREVLEAATLSKISVPYEIAVLGGGNDESVCESSFPTLSSIPVHWQRGGFAAAEMLDLLIRRIPLEQRVAVYEPFTIISRDSTNLITNSETQLLSLNNDHVIRALEFIRLNSGFAIQVEDVAKWVGVSRQWLEKRFKTDLGHSVLDEIRRHRMSRIRILLTETTLSIGQIAELSGFENANHLRLVFKKTYNMTMTDFRKLYGMEEESSGNA